MERFFYASISLFALSAPAVAQELTPPVPAPAPAQAESSDTAIGIDDIIVTASRRAENAQRAALSIQALSSDALTRGNVSKPEDLSSVAPGVSIGSAGPYPQVYIRGVGNYGTQSYSEGAVAFNLDGIYISRGWATRGMFYDLERVEVLKGPQGTLTAGTLRAGR
jgi:iron complex outermembrane receptor protein